MRTAFRNLFKAREKDAIVIVSGLPRSGTSMMMQMLVAGGMEVMVDDVRKADEDNPRGYFEYENVKKIAEDSSWLKDCHGKAFKMVTQLLYHLPEGKYYKIVLMRRKLDEVITSQRVMLERHRNEGADVSDQILVEKFEKHLRDVSAWLEMQKHIEYLSIDFNHVVEEPLLNAKKVTNFLGNRLDAEKMANVVQNSLYRQRKISETE